MRTIISTGNWRKGFFLLLKYSFFGGLFFLAQTVFSQPTPGDSGIGAASGNPVGGGATINPAFGMMILFSVLYLVKKTNLLQKMWNAFS